MLTKVLVFKKNKVLVFAKFILSGYIIKNYLESNQAYTMEK